MKPHAIRLRGPWRCDALARAVPCDGGYDLQTADLPPPTSLAIPGDWSEALGPEFCGLVRLSRQFNKPTGLGPVSRVSLVIDDVAGQAAVLLNDQPLGAVTGAAPTIPLPSLPEPAGSLLRGPAACCPARFVIPTLRDGRNEIAIDVWSLNVWRLGLVRLEIED